MIPESPTNPNVSAPPKEGSAKPEAGTKSTTQASTADPQRILTGCGLTLLAGLAVFSALHWGWYPHSGDPFYHVAVIQGMRQAGGLPVWDFWEMAPFGRPHIYPPSVHVAGFLASFAGVSPAAFMAFMCWAFWPLSLCTTWLWMHKVFGPRPALATVIFLSGPAAFFFHQSIFPGVAFGIAIAPLALLALESEKFLACAALNLLASTAHPMALFLPPALVINTLLRRKRMLAGLLAACLPMVLYLPWLAHIWANRESLAAERTGGDVTLMGVGISNGIVLGVLMTAASILGLILALVRRREALGLLGPLLGFVVVFPMGFGGRLVQFTIHLPLACLGGYGAAMGFEWLARRCARRPIAVKVVTTSAVFVALATWAAVEIPLTKKTWKGQVVPPPRDSSPVYLAVGRSMLLKLFDPEIARPGGGFERAGGRSKRGAVRPAGPDRPEPYHQDGTWEFFRAVTNYVAMGEVIYTGESGGGAFLTGCTGRWATGGMLHEVKSASLIKPESCQFLMTTGGKSSKGAKAPPECFTKIFENSYGILYKNKASLPKQEPLKAAVSTLDLMVLAGMGIGLVLFDLWLPRERVRARVLLGGGAFVVALSCVAMLAWTAAGELLHPPKAVAPMSDISTNKPPVFLDKDARDQQKPKP